MKDDYFAELCCFLRSDSVNKFKTLKMVQIKKKILKYNKKAAGKHTHTHMVFEEERLPEFPRAFSYFQERVEVVHLFNQQALHLGAASVSPALGYIRDSQLGANLPWDNI